MRQATGSAPAHTAYRDQALTETIDKWGKSLSDLFSNVTKPIFDIVLFSTKLTKVLGWQGPFSIIAYYLVRTCNDDALNTGFMSPHRTFMLWLIDVHQISGVMIRSVSPKIGRLTAEAQRLEGKFRSYHNRLITYSEEVGFYNGEKREKEIINNCFDEVVLHMHNMYLKQFFMGVADTFLVKVSFKFAILQLICNACLHLCLRLRLHSTAPWCT